MWSSLPSEVLSSWPIKSDVRPLILEQKEENRINNRSKTLEAPLLAAMCSVHASITSCIIYTPFVFRTWVVQVCSKVLFPAGAAEEVEGEVGATFPFEPDIYVGPGAVVTLTCGTLTATWVTPFNVIVKLQGKGVAQLTLHHLTVFFSSL